MADVGFRILKQDDMSDKTVYSRRNPAIDMLRALTMFTMIFVNDFWKVHDVPHWLEHAVYGEDFMGLADIVFPCFLFAVGMSIPYAIERRYAKGFSAESTLGHILSRTLSDRSILVPDGHRLYRRVEPISETGFRYSEEPFPCFQDNRRIGSSLPCLYLPQSAGRCIRGLLGNIGIHRLDLSGMCRDLFLQP